MPTPPRLLPIRPFRWDLVQRDNLGMLLDGCEEPSLWFLDSLLVCAGKVLARCDDGTLYFVGRSLDSVYDLLGGALASTSWRERERLRLVPLSLCWQGSLPSPVWQLRANLADLGLSPSQLAQRRRPVVFVDVVSRGQTYGLLYDVLREWAAATGAPWSAIQRRLRFIGVTARTKNSPNTWRWQQHAPWTRDLPARAVVNVSLHPQVWSYLGDHQAKLTPSFHRDLWSDEQVTHPRHDSRTRHALAEAVALVEAGRRPATRERLRQVIVKEPTFTEPWLRSLAHELSAYGFPSRTRRRAG